MGPKARIVDFIQTESYAVEVRSCCLKFPWARNSTALKESSDEVPEVYWRIAFLKGSESSTEGCSKGEWRGGKRQLLIDILEPHYDR